MPLRRAGAAALPVTAAFVSFWLLDEALDAVSFGSTTSESDAGAPLLLGLLTLVLGLVATPYVARASHPVARAAAAIPVSIALGLALVAVHLPSLGPWTENVTVFAMLGAAVVVLVPPHRAALIGMAVGALVAAAFGDVAWPGVALATLAPIAGYAVGPAD